MGCLLACLAVAVPRVTIAVLFFFTKYLHHAFETALWPILGFFFAPYTTLAYTWAMNSGGGVHGPFWIAVIVIAVLMDVGSHNESRRQAARRDER
ncbi:MAG: hypothetical protein ACYTG6_06520 [Planctomycetota bacterium]|jgi:hypothetical protein